MASKNSSDCSPRFRANRLGAASLTLTVAAFMLVACGEPADDADSTSSPAPTTSEPSPSDPATSPPPVSTPPEEPRESVVEWAERILPSQSISSTSLDRTVGTIKSGETLTLDPVQVEAVGSLLEVRCASDAIAEISTRVLVDGSQHFEGPIPCGSLSDDSSVPDMGYTITETGEVAVQLTPTEDVTYVAELFAPDPAV